MTKVVLIDDYEFTRKGIRFYLEKQGYLVCEAADIQTGRRLIITEQPQYAIIDVYLPDVIDSAAPTTEPLGLALATAMKQQFPHIGIIVTSAHAEQSGPLISKFLTSFSSGVAFMDKTGGMSQLAQLLHQLDRDLAQDVPETISPRVVQAALRIHMRPDELKWVNTVISSLPQLTQREYDVIYLTAHAYQAADIAAQLHLAPHTVDNYRSSAYQKLGLTGLRQQNSRLRPLVILIKAFMLHELTNEPT